MSDIDMDKLAEEVVEDLKELKKGAASVRNVKDAFAMVPDVVKRVEELAAEVKLASSQKRDLAVAVINKLVDIPYLPESVEGVIIGYAVDAIVAAANKWFGKDWLSKIAAK